LPVEKDNAETTRATDGPSEAVTNTSSNRVGRQGNKIVEPVKPPRKRKKGGPELAEEISRGPVRRKREPDEISIGNTFIADKPHGVQLEEQFHIHNQRYKASNGCRNAMLLAVKGEGSSKRRKLRSENQ
jgi:hypothetical protein